VIVGHHLWLGGGGLLLLIIFLMLTLLVTVGLAGLGILVWRAVTRQRQASQASQTAQMAPPGPVTSARTVEQRLADLDDLHGRGVITDDEHRDARAKIISET
jgi:hypothetical protein